ncbi:MAG: Ppx/GppA phosphatase family protein [Balneolaceae bacterium]|nr:Ppx/GppA phosphatase family protein [Balneolaceae bacterium]
MYASIDIGTNTVLLLVGEPDGGTVEVVHEEQRFPRLGKGVDASGKLDPDAVKRVLEVLIDYRTILENRFPEVSSTVVTATSAVRDAANRQSFIRRVKEKTGFEITLLSGIQEAEYTFAGALSVLPDVVRAAVIDIGGGSTEIAVGENSRLIESHSFDMGSVRYSERFLTHDPPTPAEIERCRDTVVATLESRSFALDSSCRLVGVAGTATSLAFVDAGLDRYEPDSLDGYRISADSVDRWIGSLSRLDSREIERRYPVVMKGRADLIVGGLLILRGFMEQYKFREVTVSTGGIRHGAILKRAAARH